jgi:hypothetical protein
MEGDSSAMKINRFDTVMYQCVQTDDTLRLNELKNDFAKMTSLLGRALFQDSDIYSPLFFDRIINYFSEPAINALYKDAIICYSPDSSRTKQIQAELYAGFGQMKNLFPSIQIPAIYFHVSGLQQNFIVADSLISCSIDKYLASDYFLYQDYFYDYQLRSMRPERVSPDFLTVWLKSEFPFKGNESVLLERMIYEGKIVYVVLKCLKERSFKDIFSYTNEEYEWCLDNEPEIWRTFIERKLLYMPDLVTTSKYFLAAPANFLSDEAPGNLGNFIGYRIVENYMKHSKISAEKLIENNDIQDILKKSKYKP